MRQKKDKEEQPMKDVVLHVLRHDLWLKILTITSIALIVAAFCCPPLAIIDNSVLAAVGELAGIGAIWEADHAITKGLDAKVKIKNIELAIENDEVDKEIIAQETEDDRAYEDSE